MPDMWEPGLALNMVWPIVTIELDVKHEFPLAAEFVSLQDNKKIFTTQLEISYYIYYISNAQLLPLHIFKNWPINL